MFSVPVSCLSGGRPRFILQGHDALSRHLLAVSYLDEGSVEVLTCAGQCLLMMDERGVSQTNVFGLVFVPRLYMLYSSPLSSHLDLYIPMRVFLDPINLDEAHTHRLAAQERGPSVLVFRTNNVRCFVCP